MTEQRIIRASSTQWTLAPVVADWPRLYATSNAVFADDSIRLLG